MKIIRRANIRNAQSVHGPHSMQRSFCWFRTRLWSNLVHWSNSQMGNIICSEMNGR